MAACTGLGWSGKQICPHCQVNVPEAAQRHAAEETRRQALMAELEGVLQQLDAIAGKGG